MLECLHSLLSLVVTWLDPLAPAVSWPWCWPAPWWSWPWCWSWPRWGGRGASRRLLWGEGEQSVTVSLSWSTRAPRYKARMFAHPLEPPLLTSRPLSLQLLSPLIITWEIIMWCTSFLLMQINWVHLKKLQTTLAAGSKLTKQNASFSKWKVNKILALLHSLRWYLGFENSETAIFQPIVWFRFIIHPDWNLISVIDAASSTAAAEKSRIKWKLHLEKFVQNTLSNERGENFVRGAD